VSNATSLVLLVAGLTAPPQSGWGGWVLVAGLFGLAGGVTNWLAVKMLFDRVPLLYGSGVIPNRFREIRQTVKDLIMVHFFAEDYLQRFFADQVRSASQDEKLGSALVEILESEAGDEIIQRQLAELQSTPAGMMLNMVGTQTIAPLVKRFVGGVGAEVAPLLAARLAPSGVEVDTLRRQVEQLLAAKLEELTPEVVKKMMEDVMREHLGWLIVWGNVFGGLIGILAHLSGY
jgi:uncharacterized membrane protein YheB (UPF0754 family)